MLTGGFNLKEVTQMAKASKSSKKTKAKKPAKGQRASAKAKGRGRQAVLAKITGKKKK